MWVFMSQSFLSIVAVRGVPGMLLVRARCEGDIERVFPKAKVSTTPGNDYLFRARVPATQVAAAIGAQVQGIDYDNFKASVREHDRHSSYTSVWGSMIQLQEARRRPARARRR
jgi:hypothetical protein